MKLALVTLLCLFVAPLAAQVAPPVAPLSARSTVEWDHTGKDRDGKVEQLQGFILAIAESGQDLNSPTGRALNTVAYTVNSVAVAGRPGIYQAKLAELVATVADGLTKVIWVQAVDTAANLSPWIVIQGGAQPLDKTPPAACGVLTRITVLPDGTVWIDYRAP